jgi:hypothetical protein
MFGSYELGYCLDGGYRGIIPTNPRAGMGKAAASAHCSISWALSFLSRSSTQPSAGVYLQVRGPSWGSYARYGPPG